MRRAEAVWPLLACLVSAAALYVSRGVLDEAILDGERVRVAFLPPWESALGLLLAAAVGVWLVARVTRRRADGAGKPTALVPGLAPALGLGALLVPYLPILPDWFPVLQILAGPARPLVWLVVAALMVWVWWQERRPVLAWLPQSVGARAVAIGLATALVCGAAAWRLTGTVLYPAGDEPHYLVVAQSLWRDGDLRIENNHQRGDYQEYFRQQLDPHYLTRGKDGEIYSIHPVGLPVLLAPVYAAGGYRAVVWVLIAMAALAAALAWRWVAVTLQAPGAATFAWAVVALSTPYLFNTFTVYPEVAAALAVMIALTTRHPIVAGIACGVLPWLSTKYAPMSAVLLVMGTGTVTSRNAAVSAIVKRVGPYAVLLVGWFGFFYAIWGSPWPQAPYGAMVQTTPWNLVFGAPGLFFDQEYGLLPYAPAYILAVSGLWVLWRAGGEQRFRAVQVALAFAALVATVGAFRIWWGGSASPSRPLASGLLLLALPIAAAFAGAPPRSARRAAQHLLLWIGVGIALQMAIAQDGFLLANGRDGTSSLLEWWSPRWEAWSLVPSFIHHEAPTALGHAVAWIAVAAACGVGLARLRLPPATAALAAFGMLAIGLLTAALVVPLLPSDPPQPEVNLRARARITALDTFDAGARPAAVVYAPLDKQAAVDLVPRFSLSVASGLRSEPQPLRVIHNGRFSLPAGRYRADIAFIAGEHPGRQDLALQLGRTGPPLTVWPVDPDEGPWSTEIHLPVDVGFVGFRGPRELERAIRVITLTPLAVIDASARPRVPQVLASARYGDTTVLFHDDWTVPEPAGFWVLGRRPTQLSIAADPSRGSPLAVRLRTDQVANHVTLTAAGWSHEVDLRPGEPLVVDLPAPARGVVALTVTTSTGFVPAERDPTSRDRRFLGTWVGVP